MKFSRRTFARYLGGCATFAAMPDQMTRQNLAEASTTTPTCTGHHFPQNFVWGSATASYQVEGAVHAEGRGVSIWDTFAHTPGKIAGNVSGDVADDFYHRFHEDIALMKTLGMKAFRFSIAWPRVFPEGTGKPNPKGLDFYHRLIDALLEAGIEPYCTLYHWDLPQPLQDRGGWKNRDTAQALADYAAYTAGKLSDKVRHFMTVNEVRTYIENGNQLGTHAPGLKLAAKELAQMSHYALLGHGLSAQAIRAASRAGTQIGIADNVLAMVPAVDSRECIDAARKALREENAMYLTAVLEGRYTDLYLKRMGADAPKFTDSEMQTIATKLDFVGLNLYQPHYVLPDATEAGYTIPPLPDSFPHMLSPWITLGPEIMYWEPRFVHELWKPKAIYITENGTSSVDKPDEQGRIYDFDRIMYLRNGLAQLQRAAAEQVPVRGYFLWSLLDNFEWADGFDRRFGMIYVDFATQKRTPKLSAQYYAQVIRNNQA